MTDKHRRKGAAMKHLGIEDRQGAGDASVPSDAKFAEARIRPCVCLEPFYQ